MVSYMHVAVTGKLNLFSKGIAHRIVKLSSGVAQLNSLSARIFGCQRCLEVLRERGDWPSCQ